MDGWIKIHRKILDNPIVCKDSDHFAVWMYLLLNAAHKEIQVLFKGKKTTLLPGQVITDRNEIAETFNISDSKVKRILIAFENDQQIDRQRSNRNSLITMRNWSIYQCENEQQNDQLMTSCCPTDKEKESNQRKSNIQELKNIKKKDTLCVSQKEKAKRFSPPTLEEVKSYCLERKNKVDVQRFIDFYTAKDWYIGKNKMKDWKAAVRTWENKDKAELKQGSFSQREYTDEALKSVLVNFED